jgi:hypothetical protein
MKPIEFQEKNVVIAKDQPEYIPLPAYYSPDMNGRVVFCWSVGFSERLRILFTGKIWSEVLTFDSPLQPQKLSVEKPDMPTSPS